MLSRPDLPVPILEQALDLDRLRAHLSAEVPRFADLEPLTATRLTGGRSNLTYLVTDGAVDFVLRRPPLGVLTPGAYNIAREYRMMGSLGGHGVRVPELLHLCEDESVIGSTFLVMQRVRGVVLRDAEDVAERAPAEHQHLTDELVRGLVELHAVDPDGLTVDAHARGGTFVARQVTRWSTQWRHWQTGELPIMDRLRERLRDAVPVTRRVSVVHGDFRFDNVMFDPDCRQLSAIFDWELSAMGDPLTDVGLLLAYWATDGTLADALAHKRLTAALGIPAAEVAERYAQLSGAALDDLPYYVALGYFKWAVIRQGVYRRQLDGAMPDENSQALRDSVMQIATQGLEIADRLAG